MDGIFSHLHSPCQSDLRIRRLAFGFVLAAVIAVPVGAVGVASRTHPGQPAPKASLTSAFDGAVAKYSKSLEPYRSLSSDLKVINAKITEANKRKDPASVFEVFQSWKAYSDKNTKFKMATGEGGAITVALAEVETAKNDKEPKVTARLNALNILKNQLEKTSGEVPANLDAFEKVVQGLAAYFDALEMSENVAAIAVDDPLIHEKEKPLKDALGHLTAILKAEILFTPIKGVAIPKDAEASKTVRADLVLDVLLAKRLIEFPADKTASPIRSRLTELVEAEKEITKKYSAAVVESISNSSGSTYVPPAASTEVVLLLRNIVTSINQIADQEPAATALKIDLSPTFRTYGKALSDTVDQRQVVATLQDPTVGRDASTWTSDYIRLFYFTDIKRLLTTLNPHTRIANPGDLQFQADADDARDRLNAKTQEIARILGAVNQMHEQLGQLEDVLAQKKRTADARARQFERAKSNKERIETEDADSATRLTEVKGQLKDQEIIRDQAQATITELDAKPSPLSKEDAAKLRQSKRDLQGANREITRLTAEKKSIEAGQARRKGPLAIATRATTDAESAKTAADADLTAAEDATTGARGEYNALRDKLIAGQGELLTARLQVQSLAQAESDAFAKARDNTPYFIAPPGGNETDPVRRVVIYGYGDSNTLFIRGTPQDVLAAKELIAHFDRPAPQARITLYTLQINGTTSTKSTWYNRRVRVNPIDAAMTGVKDELRDLRAAIAIVHETLRESITREVGRAADLSSDVIPELKGYPRLARYAFYASEVRKNLGYDIQCPSYSLRMLKAYQKNDLLTVLSCLKQLRTLPQDSEQATTLRFTAIHALRRLKTVQERYPSKFDVDIDRILLSLNRGSLSESTQKPSPCEEKAHCKCASCQVQTAINRLADQECRECEQDFAEAEYVTRWTLPDPAQVTTLGEMMFVISLASKQSRDRVLSTFQDSLYAKLHLGKEGDDPEMLKSLGVAARSWRQSLKLAYSRSKGSIYPQILATLGNSLDTTLPSDPISSETSSNTIEVLQALETRAREQVAAEISATISSIYGKRSDQPASNQLAIALRKRYVPLAKWLSTRLNVDAETTLLKGVDTKGNQQDGTSEGIAQQNDREAWQLAMLVLKRNGLTLARPRVAAADEMIKRLILATESDIEYYFVKPALEAVRSQVRSHGVELGVLEQQSILATNRLVARISTNVTSSVALAGATDLRDDASQLTSLLNAFKAENVASGLGTGSLGYAVAKSNKSSNVNAGSIGALAGLIDVLSTQAAEPRGEVFSINSNGTFKVTPIFDPSGQALQFKFDHVAQTLVQNPDGTATRELPRIERMTVNNTVQLSNLEFREIASYGMDAKVGTPDTRTGGIPIIRDLPVIRDIPLLGYYSRRNASAATRQESLIFAQTSMYPTVLDIVSLMLDVNVPPALDRTPPASLFDAPAVPTLTSAPTPTPTPTPKSEALPAPTVNVSVRVESTSHVISQSNRGTCNDCPTPGKPCKKCGKVCRCRPKRKSSRSH